MKSYSRLVAMVLGLVALATGGGCMTEHGGFIAPSSVVPVAPIVAARAFDAEYVGLYPMPVSPAISWEIEDAMYHKLKEGTPILGPIKGEFAPVFCMDPPSDEEVYKALAPLFHGVPFVWDVRRSNVQISKEKIVDQIDECKVFPLAGPCQVHHCHFKCTIWYEETTTMDWPIPFSVTEKKQEVIYIDKDHLHRCGEPGTLAGAGGPSSYTQY